MNLEMLLCFIFWLMATCSGHPRWNDVDHPNAEALERLLDVFGLDKKVVTSKKHPLPPQYMMDLYRSVEAGGVLGKHRGRVNTVRSFTDKGSGSSFFFDVSSSIPRDEDIVEAEFHLFTSLAHDRMLPMSHVLMVQLYEGPANESGQLLESRLVSGHASAWEVFRIAPTVRRWNRHTNAGLSVRVLDALGRDNFKRQIRHHSRKPIVVVFSRDHRHSSENTAHNRHFTESPSLAEPTASPLSTNATTDNTTTRNVRSPYTLPQQGDCTRHELRVDFERIGWSTWILSPKWYEAYVCAGTCGFPMGQNQRPTNHATVQSIVHELRLYPGTHVGTPSCVPTELRPVNLLYLDEHMNVVLKQYEDMVAAGCGCH